LVGEEDDSYNVVGAMVGSTHSNEAIPLVQQHPPAFASGETIVNEEISCGLFAGSCFKSDQLANPPFYLCISTDTFIDDLWQLVIAFTAASFFLSDRLCDLAEHF
jgi:hypothetical protein